MIGSAGCFGDNECDCHHGELCVDWYVRISRQDLSGDVNGGTHCVHCGIGGNFSYIEMSAQLFSLVNLLH